MCTLIAIHRRVQGAPLVVAANRDEYLDRPAEAPGLRTMGSLRALAPRDLRGGGTWLGLNEQGVFAAVTNRPCAEPDPDRRSRGLLVDDALSHASASDAARMLESLPAGAYNPFNVFVADAEHAFAFSYEGQPKGGALEPGVHVIGNADPDDRSVPKLARILEQAEGAAAGTPERALEHLREICQEHGDGSSQDTCVHLGGYGTRSSLLLALEDGAEVGRVLYADGPPCKTPYRDFTSLLNELTPGASYVNGEELSRIAS